MSYQTFKSPTDLLAQSQHSSVDEATQRAIELIDELGVQIIYIIEVIDNSEAKKFDWTEPAWKRTVVGTVAYNNTVEIQTKDLPSKGKYYEFNKITIGPAHI